MKMAVKNKRFSLHVELYVLKASAGIKNNLKPIK